MSVPATVTRLDGHAVELASAIAAIAAIAGPDPDRAALNEVGAVLRGLAARDLPWSRLRLAAGARATVHLLGLGADDTVALYAVADAVGVRSAPHVHRTWSVTIGIEGVELDTFFAHDGVRCLARVGAQRIGPGDLGIMTAAEAHATEVADAGPVLHLHLYGRPIHALPPFATRVLRAL
jgi:predicted metal-dependent enzyme (double-stranded beta helix superfamily)